MDIEKVKFILKLNKLAKEEKSNYAKFLFQENIISLYIIASLQFIEEFFNKERNNIIKIEFNIKELEGKTLGQLAYILYPYLKTDKTLKSHLRGFISLRNCITHKMLNEYNSFEELEKGLIRAVTMGGEIIEELNRFTDKFDLDSKNKK